MSNLKNMKYRIKKETKPTLPTFGKYKAVAVHHQTIESSQLYEEAARNTSISGGVLEALMLSVSEAVIRHLRNGDRVRLKDFGLLKLEIESKKVDNLKDFKAKKHIRGVRLHFIPESENGSPALYKDITFEKEIECP
jgi:nucleoid DNA-binding protein